MKIQTFTIPKLATVRIEGGVGEGVVVQITLDPQYRGDLNDQTLDGNGLYLRCTEASCINDPKLAKFMEVLHHWDHDFDGKYDGDVVANAIEEALWQTREAPDVLSVPTAGGSTRC